MDKETRARLAEARRELAEVLQSLQGRPRAESTQNRSAVAVFTGNVTIARFVQCSYEWVRPCD